jgi:polyisoprenoid-binding protein YceI
MKRFLVIAATWYVASASPAYAADWQMDPRTSRLEITASFENTVVPGVFREFDTRMRFDAEKPTEGRLDVTITVKSIDMSSADVNKAISGADWFDFARFPQAEYRAADIRHVDAGRYLAHGTLSLKGV